MARPSLVNPSKLKPEQGGYFAIFNAIVPPLDPIGLRRVFFRDFKLSSMLGI